EVGKLRLAGGDRAAVLGEIPAAEGHRSAAGGRSAVATGAGSTGRDAPVGAAEPARAAGRAASAASAAAVVVEAGARAAASSSSAPEHAAIAAAEIAAGRAGAVAAVRIPRRAVQLADAAGDVHCLAPLDTARIGVEGLGGPSAA